MKFNQTPEWKAWTATRLREIRARKNPKKLKLKKKRIVSDEERKIMSERAVAMWRNPEVRPKLVKATSQWRQYAVKFTI